MVRVRQEAPLTMGWCLDCHRTRATQPGGHHIALARGDPKAPPPGTDCGKCHY